MNRTDDPLPIDFFMATTSFADVWHHRVVRALGIGCGICLLYAMVAHAQEPVSAPEQQATSGLTPAVCAIEKQRDNPATSQDATMQTLAHVVCADAVDRGIQTEQDREHMQMTDALRVYLDGYPMAQMADALMQQDPVVAAYLVAMAKQESNWGKHVPTYQGRDCFNYWGYRAIRERMGTGGHTCFDSPEDAVATVGARVHTLVYDAGRTTARRLLVWKCGASCATHDPVGVDRWVAVVSRYYDEVLPLVAYAPPRTPLALAQ